MTLSVGRTDNIRTTFIPIRLGHQPPDNSIFLPKQISYALDISSIFLLEQISTSHQLTEQCDNFFTRTEGDYTMCRVSKFQVPRLFRFLKYLSFKINQLNKSVLSLCFTQLFIIK
jgi:hypothetical protein